MDNLKSGEEIRKMFLDFFRAQGHKLEPSASLVPFEDPSLLWVNSGVSTLKKYFDGRIVPDNPRIVSSQKCIRTNDIENVGVTARHHTFFEMLGNFSIGDYFREEAFVWAWELLTESQWFGLDPNRLYVTVYPADLASQQLWEKIGVAPERIVKAEGNFWEIGEGPCGPCSEIYYDRGQCYDQHKLGIELLEKDIENDRFLEIWNIVLSQFNAINGKKRSEYPELPNKNIDTGMGFERIVSVLQNGDTNFDTDLFIPIIKEIEGLCAKKYKEMGEKVDTAFKVIADHVRSIVFAVGDGTVPGNEGRGYVLRRLIRRSVRFAKTLEINRPFLYELVPVVVSLMNSFYPNLKVKESFIQEVIKREEERFYERLQEGIFLLEEVFAMMKRENRRIMDGATAFRLYDTYGFPLELTKDYACDEGLEVDDDGFLEEMEQQKKRARSARKDTETMKIQDGLLVAIKDESEFVGYNLNSVQSKVLRIIGENGEIGKADSSCKVQVIFDRTPFYAESGGQVNDFGSILWGSGSAKVVDVKKAPNGQHLHSIVIEFGVISLGDIVETKVDKNIRRQIEKNHTATHLLHQALRDVLGDHVNQGGSSVTSERLRFDFNHINSVSDDEIRQIETIVNDKISQEIDVLTEIKTISEAKKMGARSLFGEKYGDIVRVVSIGSYSLELCGGCHVNNLTEIGIFKIIGEVGIGSGVRRIEAVTGNQAYVYFQSQLSYAKQAADKLHTTVEMLPEKVEQLNITLKDQSKEYELLRGKLGRIEARSLLEEAIKQKGLSVLISKVNGKDINDLRKMADELQQQLKDSVIILGGIVDEKIVLVCKVTKGEISKDLHAGKIIQETVKVCGGRGGGSMHMAQGGGIDASKLELAFKRAKEFIMECISEMEG